MEPQISHRCQKCGAAFRTGAQFCAQCGAEVSKQETNAAIEDAASMRDTLDLAGAKRTTRGSNAPTQPFKPEVRELPFAADKPAEGKGKPTAREGELLSPTTPLVASYESLSKRQRVKDAAREMVVENVRPRVEKLRHASSVMLEEASAIDPSVRFVLIALVLFIVFISLLALSFIR